MPALVCTPGINTLSADYLKQGKQQLRELLLHDSDPVTIALCM